MTKQELKWCENCQDWQFCEWQGNNEAPGEPHFWLMCCYCGHEFDAEKPLPQETKDLPKSQEVLFK